MKRTDVDLPRPLAADRQFSQTPSMEARSFATEESPASEPILEEFEALPENLQKAEMAIREFLKLTESSPSYKTGLGAAAAELLQQPIPLKNVCLFGCSGKALFLTRI